MHQLVKTGKSKSFKDYSILKKASSTSKIIEQGQSAFLKQQSFEVRTSRKKSSILLKDIIDQSILIENIKSIQNPNLHLGMNLLQLKIWERIQKCNQQQIDEYSNVAIIVLKPDYEYEFNFSISKFSCFNTIKQLSEYLAKQFHDLTKNKLDEPYLSMLIGKIKTQRLDGDMRLFELLNIIMNGRKLLVLQSQIQ
ncbi:unnamed protein product (macronuclear) [Paramecium tetraurelia]|uniref:Uncharacterized protein n=1 Tax=Paramecium tetraurelia TaxID=5888 RepID=A0BV83_PARTE|nr:uncharacterized protein GSPATT00005696001 [Paramecium tetraurelia]CAK62450.1 unnamed protein product [Paramecium tetraurelia]|eukprot:XP_001429848.1 hypothetical protein (macronuclear) [Paramecium tetraurelia strain d4-2]